MCHSVKKESKVEPARELNSVCSHPASCERGACWQGCKCAVV